jgi:predicted trehalose synthase
MTVKLIDVEARWFAGKGRTVASVAPLGGGGGLTVLEVRYADGGSEHYLDIPDGFAWAPLLAGGPAEGLELRAAAALAALLPEAGAREWVPATDQSNTLAVVGERLLVKAYRRLQAGPHPEVELLAALAGRGAPVPAFAGSLHWDGHALALLTEFVPDAEAGWEAPIERAAAALRSGAEPGPEWAAAGRAAGELHAALADAFGLAPAGAGDLARWRADAEAALAEAASRDAEVAAAAPRVRARLAAFDRVAPPLVTRIHGDLHIAQLLRRGDAPPLVIDFEGDPLRPLAERRRPDTPLRDLAGLLRSIDHAGSAAARRAGDAAPDAWIAAATAQALDAYRAAAPVAVDADLLAALELAKECWEFVYAQRVLPEWLYAPRLGLRRLLEGDA